MKFRLTAKSRIKNARVGSGVAKGINMNKKETIWNRLFLIFISQSKEIISCTFIVFCEVNQHFARNISSA